MSAKNHRSGGKFGGTHTTIIPAAGIVADIAAAQTEVKNIAVGFIKAGLPSTNGHRRVKITGVVGGLLLAIRDNTSHQEIHVFTDDVSVTRLAIARGARNSGLNICFGRERENKT